MAAAMDTPDVSAREMEYRFIEVSNCNMCGSTRAVTLGHRLHRRQGLRPTGKIGITVTVVRCEDCGLIYANPLPIPIDRGQHYDVDPSEYWDEVQLDQGNYFSSQIETFRSLWPMDREPHALDIGAGLGKAMGAMARAGFEVSGLEPSPSFRAAAVDNGVDAGSLYADSIEGAEFPAATFDLVTFGAVLEHLSKPSAAIERALSWTRPGGLIHIEVPSALWFTSRLARWAYRLQGLDYVPYLSPMHPPYHLYEFTLRSFERHGQIAGYRVRRDEIYVAAPYLPRPLAMIAIPYMRRTGTGMQLEVWLEATS